MREVKRKVESGRFPRHHLWGCGNLPSGWELILPPDPFSRQLKQLTDYPRLKNVIHAVAIEPLKELWALSRQEPGMAIFAATQGCGVISGLCRRFGLLRIPLIVLVHSDFNSRWKRFWLRGADKVLVFSEVVALRIVDQGISPNRVQVIHWGPDADSTVYASARKGSNSGSEIHFVAMGKDNRDFAVLERAAQENALNGMIFDGQFRREFSRGKASIVPTGQVAYHEVLAWAARANCIVIPIADIQRVTGLTELADAIALNIPVIASDSEFWPFDFVEAGVGETFSKLTTSDELAGKILKYSAHSPSPEAFKRVLTHYSEKTFSAELVGIVNDLSPLGA